MIENNNSFVIDIQTSGDLVFPSSIELINRAIAITYEISDKSYNYCIGMTIRLVDFDEGLSINKKFKKKNKPTNVLAFLGELEKEKALGVSPPFIGDIIVCQTVVEQEAKSLDIEVSSHFIHMVVHGFLHLLGYDHLNDEQENKMKSIENKVLAELGIKKEPS